LKRAPTEKVLPGFWDIPGGTLRRYEDPLLGAIRETKEEAKIKIKNLKLFAYTANVDSKKREQFIRLIFRADYASGEVKLNSQDHADYRWLKIKDIKKYKLVNYLPKILINHNF
jgi:8-oxo-dGTP diphosphatase